MGRNFTALLPRRVQSIEVVSRTTLDAGAGNEEVAAQVAMAFAFRIASGEQPAVRPADRQER